MGKWEWVEKEPGSMNLNSITPGLAALFRHGKKTQEILYKRGKQAKQLSAAANLPGCLQGPPPTPNPGDHLKQGSTPEAMADSPYRVRRIIVRGNQRTHDSVVRQELTALKDARTLGEIGDVCIEAVTNLRGLGVFESADMLCDTAPGQSADGLPLADVVVTIREKTTGLASAQTGVHTQSGEGSMDAAVTVRNLLGRAERVDLKMEVGQQKSTAFILSAAKPRWLGTDTELTATMTKVSESHLKHSSFIEKLRTVSVAAVTGQREQGQHELSCELTMRDVGKLPLRTASWAMLQQRGMSAKAPPVLPHPSPDPPLLPHRTLPLTLILTRTRTRTLTRTLTLTLALSRRSRPSSK